ncbi:MAG TPA: PilZ domain-containing protein [Pyrinomonadaceae bacterium]|nr:PilZ domain-containing protein [Pyrinomonadaceae bacterium]
MSDVIRKLISRLNLTFVENRSARRYDIQLPIRITIEPDDETGNGNACGKLTKKRESLSVSGETKDLSTSGIAFIVPSIRLREYYMVGENRRLRAELDLPGGGKIQMQIVGVRYEQTGIHDSSVSYLIGAKILFIEPAQQEIYEEYLKFGRKAKPGKAQDFSLETKS